MIGIGKPWILAAVATSSTAGGAIGWGLGKEPKSTTLDSGNIWCRNKDLSRHDNPATCLKYDDRAKAWLYGQVIHDYSSSKTSSLNWKKVERGIVFTN